MGIVSDRRRKQRAARMRTRLLIVFAVLALGAAAMTPGLRKQLSGAVRAAQTFGEAAQDELALEEMTVFALQLGVFDSGERAAAEAKRLQDAGVLCMVWQRERMRIVSSVAFERGALDEDSAKGQDAYVIRETLPGMTLRLSGSASDLAEARLLLEAPDDVLKRLLQSETPLESILEETEGLANGARNAHPENALYTQLAQNLAAWCELMEKTAQKTDARSARGYAAVTMCTLCRELRLALENQTVSAASTASAQRTPSTAADVMPPA